MKKLFLTTANFFLSFAYDLAKTILHDILVTLMVWLVLTYVVQFPVGYVPLLGLIYIFGVLARTASHHFKVDPILVYAYKKINGRDYIYAANAEIFRKDVDIHSALEKKIRK